MLHWHSSDGLKFLLNIVLGGVGFNVNGDLGAAGEVRSEHFHFYGLAAQETGGEEEGGEGGDASGGEGLGGVCEDFSGTRNEYLFVCA